VKKAEEFLSAEEQERVRKAIEDVEAHTSGEVATMVVARSESYREAEILGAVLVAGLLALIVAVIFHHITIWSYMPMVFVLFLPAWLLIRHISRLGLPFVGRRRIEEAVQERAFRAFFEKGLHRTRDETGILIFISLLEQKVWILGDRGINEKIDPGSWQALAQQVAEGIKANNASEALIRVIAQCGEELRKHFPRRADDTDELSNLLIRE
jgi:putative membrane protein